MPDHDLPRIQAPPGIASGSPDADTPEPTSDPAPAGDSAPSAHSSPGGLTPPAAGRYELEEQIASGGMGVVYRATDAVLGREVAVKVLQDRFAPGSGAVRRFDDEARITAQL